MSQKGCARVQTNFLGEKKFIGVSATKSKEKSGMGRLKIFTIGPLIHTKK